MDKTRMNLSNNKFNQLLRKDVKEFNTFILSFLCILFLVTVGFISYKINSSYALFVDTIKGEKTIELTVSSSSGGTSTSNAVYSWSTDTVSLGASKDSISGWTTDYTTLGKNYFLKHNIGSDNIVESQEVCYILNDTQYCLKGCSNYNSDDEVCEGTNFEENSATLLESFGEDNCSVNSISVECSASGLDAYADSNGGVGASDDVTGCYVTDIGYALCTE